MSSNRETITRLYAPYTNVIFDNGICKGTGVVVGVDEIPSLAGSNWSILIMYHQIQWLLTPIVEPHHYPVISMYLYGFDCNGTVNINVKKVPI